MRARLHPLLSLGLLFSLACYAPTIALAQAKMNADSDPWDIVQATPSGMELEVRLDNGRRLTGKLLSVSDTTLRLSRRDEIAELHRDHVLKIYRLSPKSDEFRRMTRNIGALTGTAVGLEVVKDKGAGFFAIPALGGALGAFGGYTAAKRMKSRMLIYDCQPLKLPEARSSARDKPTATSFSNAARIQ